MDIRFYDFTPHSLQFKFHHASTPSRTLLVQRPSEPNSPETVHHHIQHQRSAHSRTRQTFIDSILTLCINIAFVIAASDLLMASESAIRKIHFLRLNREREGRTPGQPEGGIPAYELFKIYLLSNEHNSIMIYLPAFRTHMQAQIAGSSTSHLVAGQRIIPLFGLETVADCRPHTHCRSSRNSTVPSRPGARTLG